MRYIKRMRRAQNARSAHSTPKRKSGMPAYIKILRLIRDYLFDNLWVPTCLSIIALTIFVLLSFLYIIFSDMTGHDISINGVDVSNMTFEEADNIIYSKYYKNMEFSIYNLDISENPIVSVTKTDWDFREAQKSSKILTQQGVSILQRVRGGNYYSDDGGALDILTNRLSNKQALQNTSVITETNPFGSPQNAWLYYDTTYGRYSIESDKPGAHIDKEKLKALLKEHISNSEGDLYITSDIYEQAEVKENDPYLQKIMHKLNALVNNIEISIHEAHTSARKMKYIPTINYHIPSDMIAHSIRVYIDYNTNDPSDSIEIAGDHLDREHFIESLSREDSDRHFALYTIQEHEHTEIAPTADTKTSSQTEPNTPRYEVNTGRGKDCRIYIDEASLVSEIIASLHSSYDTTNLTVDTVKTSESILEFIDEIIERLNTTEMPSNNESTWEIYFE